MVGTLAETITFGKDNDYVHDPFGSTAHRVKTVRDMLAHRGHTPQTFAGLPAAQQHSVMSALFETLRQSGAGEASPLLTVPPPSSIDDFWNNRHRGADALGAGQAGEYTVNDLYRLQGGTGALDSKWVREKMRGMGYDPDKYTRIPEGKRVKLARRLLRLLQEENSFNAQKISKYTTEQVRAAQIREDLRPRIAAWARGELRLEKPQGSSFHHLVDYARTHAEEFSRALDNGDLPMPQLFVVDHDWGRAFSKSDGFAEITDWPLPFPNCCFEFRISGVRVLTFLQELETQQDGLYLHCVYGMDGHWQSDDIEYLIRGGSAEGGWANKVNSTKILTKNPEKFPELVAFVVAQVRAVCIMLDAKVAEPDCQRAPEALNRKRVASGKTPLRDHHVIRLSKRRRGQTERDRRVVPTGRHVRLHWRRGHWRHHDRLLDNADPDIKIIEQPNESGVWVSKQWINSMLVGDESLGFVEKEYRL